MKRRLLLALCAAMIPCAVQAGDFTDQLYTSHLGYKIKLPAAWSRVDSATVSGLQGKLPKNVDPDSLSAFDVVFFRSNMADLEFASTISVLAITETPSATTADMAKNYAAAILDTMSENDRVRNFKIVSSSVEPFNAADTIVLKFSLTYDQRRIAVEQAVLAHDGHGFVITCTRDVDVDSEENVCSEVVSSMKF